MQYAITGHLFKYFKSIFISLIASNFLFTYIYLNFLSNSAILKQLLSCKT